VAQPVARSRPPLVLVVDDEPAIVTAFSTMLASDGYATAAAHSAEEALRLLQNGVTPDAIVLDLRMPGLGGLGFLLWLRARGVASRTIPVAVVTADTHLDDTTQQAVAALGATLCYKPVDAEQLVALASRLIANPPSALAGLPDCAADGRSTP
jgi:CheY-like chemotaxis protein